ncbi:ABC transporter substrate-binding protein [Lipingzhangella sp. LS1_29]|uniref:ABC transporter substrate-binding protein n=2 Tax=Lipingzhangella rawalii TaxID=2055835 RepID=A0ABU2H4M1_9ACTN|nr:ABC transporter substrate-binding protein [Lipingzhangella rawalii]
MKRPRLRRIPLLATTCAGALLATACGAPGGDARDDATFQHLVSGNMMIEWDPALAYSGEPKVLRNTYETLTYYNSETEEIEPLLAETWATSDDGLEWTFELRDDVTFHSGEPLTAESVKAAIERTVDVDGGPAYLWSSVDEIDVADEHTVRFQLDYPAPLDLISASAYGASIYEIPEDGTESGADAYTGESYGTGPYTVTDYQTNAEYEVTLEAFDDYWGGWEDSHFDGVEFRVVEEAVTRARLVEQGEAHFVESLPQPLADELTNAEDLDILETASFQNMFLNMNTEVEPLDDPQVRAAIAHALNRNAFSESSDGDLVPPSGLAPDGVFGGGEHSELPSYDPDAAETLMEDAGYDLDADILELELTYTEDNEIQDIIAPLLQDQLSDINIELDVVGLPHEANLERAQSEDPDERQDLRLVNWWPDMPDASSWYETLFQTEEEPFANTSYYSNPDLDDMIAGIGELTATSEEEALEEYAQMEAIILEDLPAVPLGEVSYRRVMHSDIDGYVDNPLYAHVVHVHDLERP